MFIVPPADLVVKRDRKHINSNLLCPGDALKHGFFLELAGDVLNVNLSIRSELKE